jgi:hypothetical protein
MLIKELKNESHQKKYFQLAVDIQKPLGVTILGNWEDYVNQKSKLQRRCNQCEVCDSPVRAGKALAGQVCKKLGHQKTAHARRKSIGKIIEELKLFGCELLSDPNEYVNNKTIIRVRHIATGKEVSRPAQDFRVNGRVDRLLNDFIGSKYVGETIACAVSHFLLNIMDSISNVTEITPNYLKPNQTGLKYSLRHDAYFEVEGLKIALEHQGSYHFNQNDRSFKTRNRTFQEVVDLDILKRKKCMENGVFLVEIEDLVANTKNLNQAAELVMKRIQECVPKTHQLKDFQLRVEQLKNTNFVYNLCIQSGIKMSTFKRLKEQIEDEGLPIFIKKFDPVSSFFDLECSDPCHVSPYAWSARSNNLLGSKSTGRKGTRCPGCAKLLRAEKRRLSFELLTSDALNKGALPQFEKADYQRNNQVLPWIWIECGHEFQDTLAHLKEGRDCQICRKNSKNTIRRKKEFDEITTIIRNRGDTLISIANEYLNQESQMKIRCSRPDGCGEEFNQVAAKIKRGQLHGCDKHARAWRMRSLSVK